MQKTSTPYKKEMAKVNRGKSSARLRLGVMDLDAAVTVTGLFAQEQATHSHLASALQENGVPGQVYATFEAGRMRASGAQLILPAQNPQPQGYVSGELSDASCVLSRPPVIEITFSKPHKVAALSMVFDRAGAGWPSSLRIEAWRGAQKLLTENAAPTRPEFISKTAISNFDRLRLTFFRTALPFRRVRLQQIMFGFGLTLDGHTLQSLTCTHECDPLSRRLPVASLSFSVDNMDGKYNPDAPGNLWEQMERHSPIWLQFGQFLPSGLIWRDSLEQSWEEAELRTWRAARFGGTTEIVNGGRYYLTARPSAQGYTAQFEATALLDSMTKPFMLGTWAQGKQSTLYDLALSVLNDAQLPLLDNGQAPWKLWDGLKSLKTAAYLPKESGAACLQLIAHAACCCLFVDSDGYIRIEPAPAPTDSSELFDLDFSTQTNGLPQVEKSPLVCAVACKRYTYRFDREETELHKMTYTVSGSASIFVEFSAPSAQLRAEAAGGSCTLAPYVHGARLLLQVPYGETAAVTVTVFGRALKASGSATDYPVPGGDENGTTEAVENPLVTESTMAAALAKWTGAYFARRIAYTFTHRGDPSLEVLDEARTQSRYDKAFSATVVRSELQYDGTLSGKAVLKRLN